jgi:hypothetical protein
LDWCDKPQALAPNRPNYALTVAAVTQRAARMLDGLGDGGIADEASCPGSRAELVSRDQPVPVTHQVEDRLEHPTLDGDRLAAPAQLECPLVQLEVANAENHATLPSQKIMKMSRSAQASDDGRIIAR